MLARLTNNALCILIAALIVIGYAQPLIGPVVVGI